MDPSWCPGCDRLIPPKRYIVPVTPPSAPTPIPTPTPALPPSPSPSPSSALDHDPNQPPPPPAPTPVPSSPEVRKKPLPGHADAHVYRARRAHAYGGGLVHGTGRVRPGGGLKPRPPQGAEAKRPTPMPPKNPSRATTASAAAIAAADAAKPNNEVVMGNPTAAQAYAPDSRILPAVLPPVAPKKTRVVISQEPTPLYCSDECRLRDLKNSFLDSHTAGFAGAQATIHRVTQLELVLQSVERSMRNRRAPSLSDPPTPNDERGLFSSISLQPTADEPRIPPVPPNSLVDSHPPLVRTGSVSSASSASSSNPHPSGSDSKGSTLRASASKSRPRLPIRSGSFPTWGSPTKSALAPPARTLFNASSSSLDSSLSSVSAGSPLFDVDGLIVAEKSDGVYGTTPSRRGSGSSAESSKKKQKRVSFASDSKPEAPATSTSEAGRASGAECKVWDAREDWRSRRRRNPLLDANPLRDAVSVSPKDRVKASSLPSDLTPAAFSIRSSLPSPPSPQVVDTPSASRMSRYGVAMWPEDEKRTTEAVRVHGELLRAYAKRFGPREGRSLVWGSLWHGSELVAKYRAASSSPVKSDCCRQYRPHHPPHHVPVSSRREYWMEFEDREADIRALRRALAAVEKSEDERVVYEMLNGGGMEEEDQPQARRMGEMAYDGMPGPAEDRGLTYRFDRFLYPLMPPKPTIVEKRVQKWDEARQEWIEEVIFEEVYERKKLFNFLED